MPGVEGRELRFGAAVEPALQGKGARRGQGEPQVWAHPQLYPCHPHVTDTRPGVGCKLGQPFGRAVSQFMFKCQKDSPFDSAFLLLGASAKEVLQPGPTDDPAVHPAWGIAAGSSPRARRCAAGTSKGQ